MCGQKRGGYCENEATCENNTCVCPDGYTGVHCGKSLQYYCNYELICAKIAPGPFRAVFQYIKGCGLLNKTLL